MNIVKQQLKTIYIMLGIMYIVGLICFSIISPNFILGFSFGTVVSGINFYITFWGFNKMLQATDGENGSLLIGPLPKLVFIILGSIICYKLPAILPVLSFLIGVCLYPVIYLLLGVIDYLKNRKK